MFNPQTNQHTTAKRIALIVAIIIAISAISIGVAFFLRSLSNKFSGIAPTSTQSTTTPSATSANTVISDYVTLNGVQALANNYQLQQDASTSTYITLRGDGQTYTTSVPTAAYALFYANSSSEPNDSQAVLDQTTSFMSNHSFSKVENPVGMPSVPGQVVTTYAYQGSVCQLTSSPTAVPEFYTIACVDKSDIAKQYDTIQNLLALYEKTNPLPSFNRAVATTITSGNKSMTTLSLAVTSGHPILLFAAVNNNWEYLGDIGSGPSSNGKYALPPEVQTAIHDPKYGDFLTHNLQG